MVVLPNPARKCTPGAISRHSKDSLDLPSASGPAFWIGSVVSLNWLPASIRGSVNTTSGRRAPLLRGMSRPSPGEFRVLRHDGDGSLHRSFSPTCWNTPPPTISACGAPVWVREPGPATRDRPGREGVSRQYCHRPAASGCTRPTAAQADLHNALPISAFGGRLELLQGVGHGSGTSEVFRERPVRSAPDHDNRSAPLILSEPLGICTIPHTGLTTSSHLPVIVGSAVEGRQSRQRGVR